MKNIGKAVKIEFVISNLPACERKADVLLSLLSHLETKGWNSSISGFVSLKAGLNK
jgi:hypothetical protein